MVGHPFLFAMRRIVGAIQIEDDARRDAVPLPFLQVEVDQRHRQAVARLVVHGILQSRERRLTGEICLLR